MEDASHFPSCSAVPAACEAQQETQSWTGQMEPCFMERLVFLGSRHHSPYQPKFHKSVHFFSIWFPARISIPSPNLNQDRCSTQYILAWYHLHLTCPCPCVDCPPLLHQITTQVTLVNRKLDCGVASCTVISQKFLLYFLGGFSLVRIQCHL